MEHLTHEQLQEAFADLLTAYRELCASAPDGWFPFGHHVDKGVSNLEFHGVGQDGLPIWERPAKQ